LSTNRKRSVSRLQSIVAQTEKRAGFKSKKKKRGRRKGQTGQSVEIGGGKRTITP